MVGTAFHVVRDDVVVYQVREDVEECRLMGYSERSLIKLARDVQEERYRYSKL